MICWAALLNQRGLVTVASGNISCKLDDQTLLITAHDSYLGHLDQDDIIVIDLAGNILEGRKQATSEVSLHCDIHARYKETKVILHAHPPYTVAFYHYYKKLDIFSFESKMYLKDISVIAQHSPTVEDTAPVVKGLAENTLAVLKDHGVVSIGENYKQAFSKIELLEEQARVNLLLKSGKK